VTARTGAAALAALAFLASSCRSAPQVRPERESIVVGAIGAFSGEGSEAANGIVRGIELAIDEYNADPDRTFRAELSQSDTQGNPQAVAEGAQKLAGTERLIGVVGPYRAEEVEAAGPIFEASRIPFVVPSVPQRLSSRWRSFRRLVADEHQAGTALASDEIRRSQAGRLAIFHDGSPGGSAFAEGAREGAEGGKAAVMRFESIEPKANLEELASTVVQDPPDAVIHAGHPERSAALVAALRRAGFQGRFLISECVKEGGGFLGAAGEPGEGTVAACVCADSRDRELMGFVSAHRTRFASPPAPFAAEAYEGAIMLLEAVEEVEPRPEAIVEFFLSARSFLGITKSYEFNDQGELISPPVWVYELRSGSWRLIGRS
jgi:ABC-type branched-subunit amino acid transport system substrate-binding protein